jgi:hypothetical protein
MLLGTPFGTTALGVECHDGPVADESDDREVLTNLPRTRPTRRSARRATAAPEPAETPAAKPAPAKRAPTKRAPAKRPAAPRPAAARPPAPRSAPTPPEPPEPTVRPPAREHHHRSPMADLAVSSIELAGALFHVGIDFTRVIFRATVGRVPRP